MLKVVIALCLVLVATPAIADVTSELARCALEAEHLYPGPPNKGAQNWAERAANLQKRAENIETCMRAAGYRVTAECSAPLKTYESCMKIADEIMRGLVGACIMTPIGTRFAWTMNGTSGPRSGCPQVAIGRAVGGAGDMVGGGRRPSLLDH
jgi:hypothetical protein